MNRAGKGFRAQRCFKETTNIRSSLFRIMGDINKQRGLELFILLILLAGTISRCFRDPNVLKH